MTSTLCAATFSNSYVKWRLRYVMLHFVALQQTYLDYDCIVLLIDMKPATLALHCPGQNNTILRQLKNNH